MPFSLPPLAIIAGPTASGKSTLGLALAERTGGVIVNADSAQIYRDLPILSAAPTKDELGRAEHRLYGVRDGASPCSAADWAQLAIAELRDINDAGKLPILVGGTGLYLRTLLDGIAPVPAIDGAIRAEVRSSATSENYRRLTATDPETARRLNPTDTTRIARALEVMLSTKRSLRDWQGERTGGIGEQVALRAFVLLPPRDWLYQRCDARFAQMVRQGAIEEVRSLLQRRLDPALPVMRAIGVAELAAFVHGSANLDKAIEAGQQATRRYAKRQYTWFGNQSPREWRRVTDELDEGRIAALANEIAQAFIAKNPRNVAPMERTTEPRT